MKNLEKTIKESFNLKLLYVEDNAEARETSLDIFEEFFDNIVVAVDGEDGLEKFKNNDIDLIITDIYMPKMSGLEMTEEIRKFDENITILVLSAYTQTDYFLKSIKLGVSGYLFKPLNLKQFTTSIYKSVQNINLKKENIAYKNSLEEKIQEQVEILREKDNLLLQQSKMAAMGEMIDIIAHQWRQPLGLILLNADLLYMNAEDNKKIAQQDIFNHCNKTSEHIKFLSSTLNEFRNFFRSDLNIKEISIKSLFESITVLLHDALVEDQIEIEIMAEDDILIDANANDIKHLIINLISNAKDKLKSNNVRNRKIWLKSWQKNGKTTIEVRDNGGGIPEEIIDKIFKLNFTTKSDNGGTGVGLYMCKLIANKYHALLSVSNDNGAVFKITFG